MTNGERSAVTRYLRRMASPSGAGGLSDAQLVEQFVARRDEAAFEVLVWRHGPTVLGVCRRVLRQEQDAEDAFQATFLVLARRAGSIGRRQAVGGWLYRVALRVALRARARASRRADRETRAADVPAAERTPDVVWSDLRPVLDEEVSRLPAKYRAPFVLCYLDGKTNEEAARELGCPKGTVLSRLAWARERLRARLTRRGLTLSAGLLAAALAANTAAAVPTALVEATLKAALLVAAGRAVAEATSATVAALTKGALQAMLWSKVKAITACVLVAGALGLGGVWARQTLGAGPDAGSPAGVPEAVADQPARAEPPRADRPPARAEAPPAEEKRYSFEMREQPWSKVFEWFSDITGLAYVSPNKPTGTFTFIPPKGKQYTIREIFDILNEALLANTPKYVLIRGEKTFHLLPADEKIDATLVPRASADDLEKYGKTELVKVVLPLKNASAVELAPDVKRMLGTFGEVVVLAGANQLIVQDTAGNLKHVRQMVKDVEAREAEKKPAPRKR
jgi:RNA polymerase sigma factor (sigma-70 family)